jgi:hypothetical protein
MTTNRKWVYLFAVAAVLAWVGSSALLYGQKTTGSIQGTVTDSTGAVIPGVKITVTNTATNVSATTTTSSEGTYLVSNLDPSTYVVTSEHAGFERQVQQGVLVPVAAVIVVDVHLVVGEVTQSITVQAQSVPITQDTGDRGTSVQASTLEDLPVALSGGSRQVDSFVFLTPGVTGNTFTSRVNGGATYSQEMIIDGQPFIYADHGGAFETFRPSFESVDQFSVQTNVYSAKYGRGTGVYNFHLASGGNAFHGDIYDFLRNDVLDARGFFAPTVGQYKQNEFGPTLGGPVYIPKIYDGRNRTFFHFSYGGFRFRGGTVSSQTTFPTAAQKQGDFSNYTNAQGQVIPIYDPATTAPDGAGGLTRSQFSCNGALNVICPNRISPISQVFLPLMPSAPFPGDLNNALVSVIGARTNQDDWTVKVDHTISSKYVFHGSYEKTNTTSTSAPSYNSPLAGYGTSVYPSFEPRMSLDMSLRPNLQNNVSIGYNRAAGPQNVLPINTSTNSPISPEGYAYPAITIPGYVGYGNGDTTPIARIPAFGLFDNLTWVKGHHTLQFGVDLRWEDETKRANNNYPGSYNFANTETSLPDSPNFALWGSSFAGFLLGDVNTYTEEDITGFHNIRTRYRAFYVQDDFKVTTKLTLNLGLRYDIPVPVTEKYDRLSTLDLTVPNPGAGGIGGALTVAGTRYGPLVPNGPSLGRSQIADTRYYMWQPRFGFAYQLNNHTVLRGGAGLTYFRGGALSLMGPEISASYLAGFRNDIDLITPNNGISPTFQWDAGLPHYAPAVPSLTFANGQTIDYMGTDAGEAPYQENWSFTIERELPWRLGLEVSYVGSAGHKLGAELENLGQVNSKYLSLGNDLNADISCLTSGSCPLAAAAGVKLPYAGFTGPVSQALRPFPQYDGINSNVQETGNSSYHALQVRLQKYYSNGVSLIVAYTASKNLTDTTSQFDSFNAFATDTYNRKLEKAIAYDDAPQILAISATYELPIGPHKQFLTGGGPAGKVVGGWNVSAILTYDSGTSIGIGGGQPLPLYGGTSRPDLLSGVNPLAYNGGKFDPAVDKYLNVAAFTLPPPYTIGTSPIYLPATRGFGTANENVALIKRTPIKESMNIEFRAEAYNIFNRTQFGAPDGNANDTVGFGTIGSQANTPRIVQFGLKFNW